jgi:hypothetical protein
VPIREVTQYIYDDHVRSVATTWPTQKGEEDTVRFALGSRDTQNLREKAARIFNPLFFQ